MDKFNLKQVFSSIDYTGRYSYENQPYVMLWNLTRFAETILFLLDKDESLAIKKAEMVLTTFHDLYEKAWLKKICSRIGLNKNIPSNKIIVEDFLRLLQEENLDYNNSFLCVTRLLEGTKIEPDHASEFYEISSTLKNSSWFPSWLHNLSNRSIDQEDIIRDMKQHNPTLIPRNHIVEKVINAAIKNHDFKALSKFINELRNPFKIRDPDNSLVKGPTKQEEISQTFCGT